MKHIIAKLEKIEKQIIEKSLERDKIALGRSDKWLASPQGKIYEHRTSVLADSVEGIRKSIKDIKAYIE